MSLPPSWVNHQSRAIEPDGTVHAAQDEDSQHFTIACAVCRDVERVDSPASVGVTCVDCIDLLDANEEAAR